MSIISETATSFYCQTACCYIFQGLHCHGFEILQGSHILLHLVEYATCLSASTEIKSKDPRAIFCIWIQVYGPAEKFLSNNGGEYANQDFLEICEAMNKHVHTRADELPFSNGLIECNNLIFPEMLDKVLENQNINFQLALAWCTNEHD